MPTVATAPVIILMFVLWRLTKGELLSIVLFFSIFGAASALNIAGSGVAPWIFVLAIGLFIKLLKGFARPSFIDNCDRTSIRLLLAFVCYATLTGIAYPSMFQGIPVFNSHSVGHLVPLSWGTANAFQIFYLLACTAVYFIGLCSNRKSLESAMNWYVNGCIVICFFALYQLANSLFHIPYPSAILYSNPVYVIYPAYKIGGFWRLNSTLTEASSMAYCLVVGIALQGWKVVTGSQHLRSSLQIALMVICVLLTQSSGGYLCLIFILVVSAVFYGGYLFRRRNVSRPIFIGLIVCAIAAIVATTATAAPKVVEKEIQSVLLEKKNSASYKERTASSVAAVQVAHQTYFLGAGWGSLRCSGLGYLLLGTVGIPGLLLFISALLAIFIPLLQRSKAKMVGNLYQRSLFAMSVSIFGMAIAGSEPVNPILWALFAAGSAGPYLVSPRCLRRRLTVTECGWQGRLVPVVVDGVSHVHQDSSLDLT